MKYEEILLSLSSVEHFLEESSPWNGGKIIIYSYLDYERLH